MVAPAAGERTELGCATLSNWADKLGNLLTLELDLEPGDELPVDAGSHWTTLVVLVGAWRAGVVVRLGDAGSLTGPAVVHEHRLGDTPVDDDVLVIGAGMAGRHAGEVRGGLAFNPDVLSMPDELTPAELSPDHPALRLDDRLVTHGALARGAAATAQLLGLAPRARLASARPIDRLDGLVAGPLAAWTAEASLVLVADPAALADVAARERADLTLDLDDATPIDVRCHLDPAGQVHVRLA